MAVLALGLLPAAARAAGPRLFDVLGTTLTWDDNLSNSDREPERIAGLRTDVRAEGLHVRELAGGDSLRLLHHLQLETAWDYRPLTQATAGLSLRRDLKFGLGPYAPIVGATVGAEGLVADESQRNGASGSADLHGRLRFGISTQLEVREEFSRRLARGDVFESTSSESILKLTCVPVPRWEFTAEARQRHGDVVSYAVPPRSDLLGEARALTSLDTFGATRTAYAINARSRTLRLTATYMAEGGWFLTAGFEPRETRRSNISYSNRRWTLAVRKI